MNPQHTARRALACLDLTSLNDDDTEATIEKLCARAATPYGPVAAVCVWPRLVEVANVSLEDGTIRVAAVADFPGGSGDPDVIARDIDMACAGDAREIDLVFPYRAFIAGDRRRAENAVKHARKTLGRLSTLKVILESGAFSDQTQLQEACRLAIACGADFLKTSTGKIKTGATKAAAETMLRVIHAGEPGIGFKVSGGVRTLDDASLYLGLADEIMGPDWVQPETFRIGASGLLDVLLATLGGAPAPKPARGTY